MWGLLGEVHMDSRTVVDHLHAYEACGGKIMPEEEESI
jgi:hypothetical protein